MLNSVTTFKNLCRPERFRWTGQKGHPVRPHYRKQCEDCHQYQGYFFAHPMDSDGVSALLKP
jgi:hypothetical protein